MKILFAGCPEIGVPTLERIAHKHTVVGVLTNPDRSCGRGRRRRETPVKSKARELGLSIIECESIDSEVREKVGALSPQLLVVVAFGMIFDKVFLDLFPLGGINVHPSLLPKYRGASPLQTAILQGEKETGVTVQKLALKMDSGAILAQEKLSIGPRETAGELALRAAECGSRLITEVVDQMESGTVRPIPQNEEVATYCKLIRKQDGKIDWTASAPEIVNKILAFNPWPIAFTFVQGKRLNLLRADYYTRDKQDSEHHDNGSAVPGKVLGVDKSSGILIQTGDGILVAIELQLQAKKALGWQDFINGNPDIIGTVLGED
jgi:methionyl-tRNA formyltransferase